MANAHFSRQPLQRRGANSQRAQPGIQAFGRSHQGMAQGLRKKQRQLFQDLFPSPKPDQPMMGQLNRWFHATAFSKALELIAKADTGRAVAWAGPEYYCILSLIFPRKSSHPVEHAGENKLGIMVELTPASHVLATHTPHFPSGNTRGNAGLGDSAQFHRLPGQHPGIAAG